jgi:hypothetical protein
MDPAELIARLSGLHDALGRTLVAQPKRLRCSQCIRSQSITATEAAHYLRTGWPTCCGHTMVLENVAQDK